MSQHGAGGLRPVWPSLNSSFVVHRYAPSDSLKNKPRDQPLIAPPHDPKQTLGAVLGWTPDGRTHRFSFQSLHTPSTISRAPPPGRRPAPRSTTSSAPTAWRCLSTPSSTQSRSWPCPGGRWNTDRRFVFGRRFQRRVITGTDLLTKYFLYLEEKFGLNLLCSGQFCFDIPEPWLWLLTWRNPRGLVPHRIKKIVGLRAVFGPVSISCALY